MYTLAQHKSAIPVLAKRLKVIYILSKYHLLLSIKYKLCKLQDSKASPDFPQLSFDWKLQLKRAQYETKKEKHSKGNDINKYKYCLQAETEACKSITGTKKRKRKSLTNTTRITTSLTHLISLSKKKDVTKINKYLKLICQINSHNKK